MATNAQIFGVIPNPVIASLVEPLTDDYLLTHPSDPVAIVSSLLYALYATYKVTFPDGAENYTVTEKRQNLSTDEQRVTYTITIDHLVNLGVPVPVTAIVPEPEA